MKSGNKNVLLFPGYGIYQKNMMGILSEASSFLRERISAIDKITSGIYHIGLLDEEKEDDVIKAIRVFASEIVIAEMWENSGLKIDYLIGHSMGEYAAAVISGIMSQEDGIYLLKERVLSFHEDEPHCTAFSESSADKILEIADEYGFSIYIISYNTSESVTVCGMKDEINQLVKICRANHIRFGVINKFNGAHYPGLKPYSEVFLESAKKINFRKPVKNMISTVYPDRNSDLNFNAEYWAEHIYKPIRFRQAIERLPEDIGLVLDVGISPVLLGMAKSNLSQLDESVFIPTIQSGRNYRQQIENSMQKVTDIGISINTEL